MDLEQRVAALEARMSEAEELADDAVYGLQNIIFALAAIAERLRIAVDLPTNELVEVVEAIIAEAAAAGLEAGQLNWPSEIVAAMEHARPTKGLGMKESAELRAAITLVRRKGRGRRGSDPA